MIFKLDIKLSVLIIALFFFVGCQKEESPEHCKQASRFMRDYINHTRREYGVFCCGGGGGFMETINHFDLTYDLKGKKTIEELRVILVFLTEDMLSQINTDKGMHPYLVTYPFKPENIRQSIILQDRRGRGFRNPGKGKELIFSACSSKGTISYNFANDEETYLQTLYEEPYEEAYEIVKQQMPEIARFRQKVSEAVLTPE